MANDQAHDAPAAPTPATGKWAEALAGLGLAEPPPDAHAEVAYLWPCNVAAWAAWCAVQTQWRVGMQGATGLCYAGVRAWLDEAGTTGDDRRDLFAGIQAAERATLAAWADQRKQQQQANATH